MTKARKASAKKTNTNKNQGIKIASALFIALGVLVVLSMLLSSIFTQNPQSVLPAATQPLPTIAATAAP